MDRIGRCSGDAGAEWYKKFRGSMQESEKRNTYQFLAISLLVRKIAAKGKAG